MGSPGRVWSCTVLGVAALLGALAVCPIANAAEQAASDWSVNEQGRVRLVSAVTAAGDSGRVQLGLEFTLKPGWKVYWRSPGDAGYPPAVDWKGSDNLAETVISWPAPHRFSVSGLETMGYKDEVVLPIIARLNEPIQALSLHAAVDYLTCDVLCVPQHADLALELPAGAAQASTQAYNIGRFLARVPGDGARQGLALVSAQQTQSGALKVVVAADPPLTAPDLFVERADQMQFAKPRVRLEQGGKRAVFVAKLVPKTGEGGIPDKPVTLTVVDGNRGMEVVTGVAPAEQGSRAGKLLAMMGLALLGGFILNLMPCVLPVLSLKVLGLIGQAGAERRAIRTGFLASAGGILASFLVLAGATVAVKAAGAAVGWGIQFQQPLFLASMVVVIVLFAGNLFGFYEIPLPQWATGLGRGHGQPHGLAGNFAAGAFATLLATPCSAPFLGTAIGFALARGPLEIFAIFALLGVGMAIPYMVVAGWPQLAQRLPRAGHWMITLRRLLGVVMMGTAVWLLVVLAAEAGPRPALTIALLMAGSLAVLAVGGRLVRIARLAVIAGLVVGSLAVALGSPPAAEAGAPAQLKGMWKPFDKEQLAKYVSDGKVVFVDVTADWCLTCQVNKATVVYRGEVAAALANKDIVAMEADWTRPNEAISSYLASFGRYGIPFNAVYGPGAPDGLALPELLTDEAVLKALGQARKSSLP
jgi:suppressor for copper-sensitivity B